MTCVRRVVVAGAAAAALLAACGITRDDPCAGATTCVRVDVDSFVLGTIDQLELDLVYEGFHATTTTGAVGTPIELPLSTAIILDLPTSPLIEIDIVAAGKLGGAVLGTDSDSTTVQQGHHTSLTVYLNPISPCTEDALYCGGSDVAGEYDSLYRCTRGVPIFYARCSSSCTHVGEGAGCFGPGLCRDGGTYCGGNAVDGDPYTLYVCDDYEGTAPMQCPSGCIINGDGNDRCR